MNRDRQKPFSFNVLPFSPSDDDYYEDDDEDDPDALKDPIYQIDLQVTPGLLLY